LIHLPGPPILLDIAFYPAPSTVVIHKREESIRGTGSPTSFGEVAQENERDIHEQF
jgi:hypothetical protein